MPVKRLNLNRYVPAAIDTASIYIDEYQQLSVKMWASRDMDGITDSVKLNRYVPTLIDTVSTYMDAY